MFDGSKSWCLHLRSFSNHRHIGTVLCFRVSGVEEELSLVNARFCFSCPYLTTRLSPAIPVFAAILYLTVIGFIFRTACSDPGILPRATPDEVLYLERSSQQCTMPCLISMFS